VTDGARPLEPGAFPFHRALQVGERTENLALVRLAVRPSLQDPDELSALAVVVNAGQRAATGTLRLALADTPLGRWPFSVEPGEDHRRGFRIGAAAAGILSAAIDSAEDALPLDDTLSLEIGQTVRKAELRVGGDCGRAVAAAIAAHPGLGSGPGSRQRLRLWCSDTPPPDGGPPLLWLLGGEPGQPIPESPVWTGEGTHGAPLLQAAWIDALPPPRAPDGHTLLRAGDRALIAERREPHRIEVGFDLNAPALAGRPEMPLLLDFLLARLAGGALLLPTSVSSRDPADAAIAPGVLPTDAAEPQRTAAPLPVAPLLIGAALALMLPDLRFGPRRGVTA
jgi:hypothetical protein